MSQLIPFENGGSLPAHIARMFGGSNEDLQGGLFTSYPIISFKGKVWHIVEGDKRTLVSKVGGDPDEAASSIEVVILKANPNKSKLYYAQGYEEGSTAKPTCYSNDGIAPAADVQVRQNPVCGTCPRNIWGSKVTENGAKSRECSDSRRMAVAPIGRLDMPMLLRVPAGSLNDLGSYATMLDGRKVSYSAVVTKISFDHNVAHQKFIFKPLRFVTEEEAETILDVGQRDVVQNITGLAAAPAAIAAPAAEVDTLGPTPAHIAQPASKAKRAATVTDEEIEAAFIPPAQVAQPATRGRPVGSVNGAKKAAQAPAAAVAAAPVKQPEPAVAKPKKFDEAALLEEASASLDEALAALDD